MLISDLCLLFANQKHHLTSLHTCINYALQPDQMWQIIPNHAQSPSNLDGAAGHVVPADSVSARICLVSGFHSNRTQHQALFRGWSCMIECLSSRLLFQV